MPADRIVRLRYLQRQPARPVLPPRPHSQRFVRRLAALYACVLDPRRRVMQLLRDFDSEFDTAFFKDKSYADVRYRERHLDEQLLQWNIPGSVINDICRYCQDRYWQWDDARQQQAA